MRFVDNFTNKTNLADAYMDVGRFNDAVSLYKDCLNSFMAEDVDLQMKLLTAHFYNQDFSSAIEIGKKLDSTKGFKNSEARIYYAWSYYYNKNEDVAHQIFEDLNVTFSNYKHRLEFCRFLKEVKKTDALVETVKSLLEEFEHMKGPERRLHRDVISDIKNLARTPIRSV